MSGVKRPNISRLEAGTHVPGILLIERLAGEDITALNFGFKVGDNFASRIGDLFWFGPLSGMQKLFFRTPLVYLFVFGSYFYHDRIWWPFVGRRIMEVIEANTVWGKLFSEY